MQGTNLGKGYPHRENVVLEDALTPLLGKVLQCVELLRFLLNSMLIVSESLGQRDVPSCSICNRFDPLGNLDACFGGHTHLLALLHDREDLEELDSHE